MDFTSAEEPQRPTSASLLDRLEQFYDAVPRKSATAEDHGSLTLFVCRGAGWPLYARPTPGVTEPVTAAAVTAVRRRQRALGVPEAFEWVLETSPGLEGAATQAGLVVQHCPLLVLTEPVGAVAPDGVTVSILGPDDADLAATDAVAAIGFGAPGTSVAAAGPVERDAAAAEVRRPRLEDLRSRLTSGQVVQAVARGDEPPLSGPLAIGTYQHAAGVAEIVGVATLPAARRRGLAAAVTARLARHAREAGFATVFLSAQDETVARVYERVGFRRVATAGIAAPPES